MKTISSEKSLIIWGRNANRTNITKVPDKYYLKEDYLKVFMQLRDWAAGEGSNYSVFIKKWHDINTRVCTELASKLVADHKESSDEEILAVINKFRGNVGEIMAEKIFTSFSSDFDVVDGSYETVDPDNEMFVDAKCISRFDKMPLGVQVKNYKQNDGHSNPVVRETFVKSIAMTTIWLQDLKLIDKDSIVNFISRPRQIIFSFTDVSDGRLLTDYAGSTMFYGPHKINKLELHNKSWVFDDIVKEIESLA